MRSSTHAPLPIAFGLLSYRRNRNSVRTSTGRWSNRRVRSRDPSDSAARCLGCHDADRRKGGFRLDRRESFLAGGDSGPVLEVGKSAESLLIEKVAGLDPPTMPPKGEPLTPEQVGLLRAWIDQWSPLGRRPACRGVGKRRVGTLGLPEARWPPSRT